MPSARRDGGGGLQETDNRDGTNVLGAPVEEGGVPVVRSLRSSGIAADTPPDTSQSRTGPPPPTSRGGTDLPGLLPETSIADLVTGRGVPERGVESEHPPDSLCTPPRAGDNCDPGGGSPTIPQVLPV